MKLLFTHFEKGSGDISENGEKVVDSCMQIGLLHAGIKLLFTICKWVAVAF
jgi:hypothetical protein